MNIDVAKRKAAAGRHGRLRRGPHEHHGGRHVAADQLISRRSSINRRNTSGFHRPNAALNHRTKAPHEGAETNIRIQRKFKCH
ncbi:hypothetical protein [Burkholderia gladioli]|uniref:Uncharacterized protein n=1 Tax=Burkholderia gladioli TaxID=28095 RepID=A0AB38TZ49_BURGA|nr:hypothetical protein [Burkholderia gladioli]MBJ9678366.1 hypothetical protein [Burkholderia gladioli]MBU9174470.1 hypothetical protein [Burkholderia gladioli]MBU9186836.1 hypothetical protein [Burkholderia gladioli]MBU9268810.1 hypothetical protein [Burkholderia gladioli]MBU9272019.1 hypothetical protein [Burkholderia gladioli]